MRIKALWGYLDDGAKLSGSKKKSERGGIKVQGEILARDYNVPGIG